MDMEITSKFSAGSAVIDWLLDGGFERDCITTIYGPAGSGKTNICLIAVAAASKDGKIIYIDTEGSFSIARLQQITPQYEEVLKRIIILQPTDFEEQHTCFEKIRTLVDKKTDLIIIDSIAMLYRLEIGQTKAVQKVNRELGTQLAYLIQLARKEHVPVLVTNQVYKDFEDNSVKMVGGDLLRYASKCLIELRTEKSFRRAILRKHRSIEENREIKFIITDAGVTEYVQEQ